MVTLAVWLMPTAAALADTKIPLPQPRPAAAPAPDGKQTGSGASPQAQPPPAAPPPSACRLALTDAVAIAPSIPAITGPGACGGDDLVRLEAVVLPDRSRVAVKPAATLRCTMASAIADWVRSDMAPLAEGLGTQVSELDNFDSFECRGRNRVAGAKLSEHGRANALDVRALKLANGQALALTDRTVPRDLREKVLGSVCARFTTVLGPGSDGYHEDHIHLDLAERRNGYRICHWEVYDPMPTVAPLLPSERPAEAPPRETVAGRPEASPPPANAPAMAAPAVTPDEHGAADKSAAAAPTEKPSAHDAKPAAAPPLPVAAPKARTPRRAGTAERSAASAPAPAVAAKGSRTPKRKPKRRRSDLPPFLRQLFN